MFTSAFALKEYFPHSSVRAGEGSVMSGEGSGGGQNRQGCRSTAMLLPEKHGLVPSHIWWRKGEEAQIWALSRKLLTLSCQPGAQQGKSTGDRNISRNQQIPEVR